MPRIWLTGLRRAWTVGGALKRWVEDRGVTGVVWSPASYEVDDVAESLGSLVGSGAKADASLHWDLSVADVRAASEVLAPVYRAAESPDGFVAVWLDPSRASDPGRAVTAARELVGDVRRANVAVALAWSPQRAAVVEALVAAGVPVALAGATDASVRQALVAAVGRGVEKLRADAPTEEDAPALPDPKPVFLLGSQDEGDLLGVELASEFSLFGAMGAPRVPLSPDAEQGGLNAAVERLVQRSTGPLSDDAYTPVSFTEAAMRECVELQEDEVLEDVWSRDHTIWKDDPAEISNRLGWLDAPERFHAEISDITQFGRKARADISHVVVCGMGGSVFACEMFDRVLGAGGSGVSPGKTIPLAVLDSTDPDHVDSVRASLDLEKTLFVVSSKSGTTAETRSHLEYFWSLVPRGDRFVAITDPGTELGSVARERGFLRVFENPPEIGGRFSGLSYFGLVPAAISGVDIEAIVAGARRAMVQNAPGVAEAFAPGVRLGAAIGGALVHESRDKLTLILPDSLRSFGVWVEQLICESLGKEGKGIVPVLGEPLGSPDSYGSDRIFCVYSVGDESAPAQLESIETEHPVISLRMSGPKMLGAEMYRWEVAVAIVGYLLDINPFDQPDVEAAKERAREALQKPAGERADPGSANELIGGGVEQPRYIAIQAFVTPTDDNARRLEAVRDRLRARLKVPVTLGFGPRFLHSTGQLHKGGPNTGVFLQVTGEHVTDVEVPGKGYSFGRLIDAQADGDLLALRDAGRPVARLDLEGLEKLAAE